MFSSSRAISGPVLAIRKIASESDLASDVRALVAQARAELGEDPVRVELFKIFVLAAMCGLRRREIDLLPWTAFREAQKRRMQGWSDCRFILPKLTLEGLRQVAITLAQEGQHSPWPKERRRYSDQFIHRDGHFAHPFPGRMIDRVRDRRSDPSNPNFSDTPSANWIKILIGLVNERDVNFRNVPVDWNVIGT